MNLFTFVFALTGYYIFELIESSIVLEGNGYTGIVVAISEDVPQPSSDVGLAIINTLQNVLSETSAALFSATNQLVYLRTIDILLPSTWIIPIPGITPTLTRVKSYQQADIRIDQVNSISGLPYTIHSGKCGVAGNFISLPVDYLLSTQDDTLQVKAKAMTQLWAQFRYGVFEEHGYPGDSLLPYFYRHPDGYDAVTTSNDTVINGNVTSLSGSNCLVDDNGIISNQNDCRFIPNSSGQTATRSLMSFHWVDSIFGFSDKSSHDRRPPNRQNRLCDSKSSWEVISQSPDIMTTSPVPGANTKPTYRIERNLMQPVIIIAFDTSFPTSIGNAGNIGIVRRSLTNLLTLLVTPTPDLYVGLSSFQGIDQLGTTGSYLKTLVAPIRLADGQSTLNTAINSQLSFNTSEFNRNVPAVLRDVFALLAQYRDVGGSIAYLITSTGSSGNDLLLETDLAEKFMFYNIKLIVAESGSTGVQALDRFTLLSEGSYYTATEWGSTSFFTPINNEIASYTKSILSLQRRTIISERASINSSIPWTGTFQLDQSVGTKTGLVLQTPKSSITGEFTATITNPAGEQVTLSSGSGNTNWNDFVSTVGVTSLFIEDVALPGIWNYSIVYDTSSCGSCSNAVSILFQVTSSLSSGILIKIPRLHSWVSLTPGKTSVDLAQHPAVISARFDSSSGRLGDLNVFADISASSTLISSIPLTDIGTLDSDISRDGLYSGIFYPPSDGTYTVKIVAKTSAIRNSYLSDRLLQSNQDVYCCGSSLPVFHLNFFQITGNNELSFSVINTIASLNTSPIVTDLQVYTYCQDAGRVYFEASWTTPFGISSQVLKCSEDFNQILDNFDSAPEVQVEYGLLSPIQHGTHVSISASAPYTTGENVYVVVQVTGINSQTTRSHLAWTEKNPPNYPFTSPIPTTPSTPMTSTMLSSSTSTEITNTLSSTVSVTTTVQTTLSSIITDSSTLSSTLMSTSFTTIITSPTSTDSSSTSSSTVTSPTTVPSTSFSVATTDSSTTTSTPTTIPPLSSTDTSLSSTVSPSTETSTSDVDTTSPDPGTSEPTTDTTTLPTTQSPGISPETIGIISGSVIGGVVLIGATAGGVWYMKANSIAMFASSSGGTVGGGEVGVVSQSIIPDVKSSINDPPPSYYSTSVIHTKSEPLKNEHAVVKSDPYSIKTDVDISIEDDEFIMTAM